MLIQFNCKNFKSYRDEFSLDMGATSITENKESLIEGKKGEKYVKTAVIYGANASGKSNVIEAFQHMKFLVETSFSEASKRKVIPLKRFQFDEKSKKLSSIFEVFFKYGENEYQYGFELDSRKIKEEWLYKRDFRAKEKYNLIFERDNQKFELNEKLEKFKEMLKGASEKTLLLSFLSNISFGEIENVYKWFLETEVLNFGDSFFDMLKSMSLPKGFFEGGNKDIEFENYLKAIDVGIESVRLEEIPNSEDENGKLSYNAFSIHTNRDTGQKEELRLQEESSGTLKMISLYEDIKGAIMNGSTLFVDELDAKLHPLLTKYLVQLFHNNKTNPKSAQLIFSTHDTNNLTKNIFRRDQIWFVEKNKDNSSELYSLAEYKIDDKKVRKDASYNKDYLGGRYGAIPILKEFEIEVE